MSSSTSFKAPISTRIWRQMKKPIFVAPLAFLAGGFWIQTYLDNINSAKSHSQLFKAIMLKMNEQERILTLLGPQIRINEAERIKGDVNQIKGVADLSFTVYGDKGAKAKVHYVGDRYKNTDCWISSKFEICLLPNGQNDASPTVSSSIDL